MIQQFLLFRQTGILLYQKKFCHSENPDTEDLISGFFSVVFQYFSNQFGQIRRIETENNLILISKIDQLFIALISSWIKEKNSNLINDNIYFLNKRLEDIAVKTLKSIERRIFPYVIDLSKNYNEILLKNEAIDKIEKIVDEILNRDMKKMDVIRSINSPGQISTDYLKIYRNFP